jgi:hypothetical protein
MKRLAVLLASLVTAAVVAAPALAEISIGVADDGGKLADDGGAWFVSQMKEVGLQENRITIGWNPEEPTTIPEQDKLGRYIATATANGIASATSRTSRASGSRSSRAAAGAWRAAPTSACSPRRMTRSRTSTRTSR